MLNNDKGRSLIILLIFVAILCTAVGIARITAVSAQGDGPMPGMGGMDGMPGGMMMPGMDGRGMPGMMPGMPGMMGSESSIAVAEGFVYVVHGGRLSMFSSKTLKLVKSVDLMPMMGPGGPGRMGGGGRQGGKQMPR